MATRHPKYTAEAARLKPSTKATDTWIDPRGLSYLSSEEDRKRADAKIREVYDHMFDSGSYTTGLAKSIRDTKDKVTSAIWSAHSDPVTWSATWDEYSATKGELAMNPFLDKVVKMEYVGSRITCLPAPKDTDEDVLLLTDNLETLIGDCIEVGFTRDGDATASYPTEFVSLRNGTMNFIVTDNEEFFDKFMLATFVCKSLNVLEKQHRITVFQAILYGEEYQPVEAPF